MALLEGLDGPGSGCSLAAAAAMQLKLLEPVTVGAGGSTTALFLPTVALTLATASLLVGDAGVAGEGGGFTESMGSDGRRVSGIGGGGASDCGVLMLLLLGCA